MLVYLFKRLLYFIPTLLVIASLAFFLSKIAPGDPVLLYLNGVGESNIDEKPYKERIFRDTRKLLKLDKPAFYLAIRPQAYPDTLYRLNLRTDREVAKSLLGQFGDWEKIHAYQDALAQYAVAAKNTPDSLGASLNSMRRRLKDLRLVADTQLIAKRLVLQSKDLVSNIAVENALKVEHEQLLSSFQDLCENYNKDGINRPKLTWYGWDNQFHLWFKGILVGNFGYSYRDGQSVQSKIGSALRWTLLVNGLAIIIAYGLSIFIGVYTALRKGQTSDRITTTFLFFLYSLPSFWIATLLLIFFTTPSYGLQFFSITSISDLSADTPFWERFYETARHLVLPVFCLCYGAIAIISIQMRGGMLDVLGQDYIRTAQAKGLSNKKVIWKHAFPNALFPIITILGALFPATIAGSVIVENIFNIPGMGQLMIKSIGAQDWPVVYAIMILSALLTMLGILVADLLYKWVDPRVNLGQKRNK